MFYWQVPPFAAGHSQVGNHRLTQLDAATRIEDLYPPLSNKLEAWAQIRTGQRSIRINNRWRVCFRFKSGDEFDVEITIYP
ncbi:MAG: type II toxin-antitoxin system RelE/ParE family toxin [Nitrosomonas sp.]|nr:MAG: type II toxin-antitoxin system RelE/ParE family toxin [Nitrosomonas sp.]